MTALSPQLERTLTRPWSTAAALAALFAALEGLMGGVNIFLFIASFGDELGPRLDILGQEWLRYSLYALIGLAAAYVLRLGMRSDVAHAWPTLVVRAAILYIPVSIVITFLVAFTYALAHDLSFPFLGIEILG